MALVWKMKVQWLTLILMTSVDQYQWVNFYKAALSCQLLVLRTKKTKQRSCNYYSSSRGKWAKNL